MSGEAVASLTVARPLCTNGLGEAPTLGRVVRLAELIRALLFVDEPDLGLPGQLVSMPVKNRHAVWGRS